MDRLEYWLKSITDQRVAIVVAHPDDETFFVSVLTRYPRALVIHVTDGAPEDPSEWQGLPTRRAYAEMRSRELAAALDAAGHTGPRITFGITDMQAVRHLAAIARRIIDLILEHDILVAFTHAYEGGHPDHDTTAFAAHFARQTWQDLLVVEAPFYRKEKDVLLWQTFIPMHGTDDEVISLTPAEQALKRKMVGAHQSQWMALEPISFTHELLRETPAYDFSKPANGSNLSELYARAGIDEETWRGLMRAALFELEITH